MSIAAPLFDYSNLSAPDRQQLLELADAMERAKKIKGGRELVTDLLIEIAAVAGLTVIDRSIQTVLINRHVEAVRHYLHLQIGKPLSKNLISAPEIALDNLQRELVESLTVPPRPSNQPS